MSLHGIGRFWVVGDDPATGRLAILAAGTNDWPYTWAAAAVPLFAGADPAYKLSYMYIEFANSTTPVTPPTVSRSDGIDYYQGLASDPIRDYIRVPLLLPPTPGQDPDYAGTPAMGGLPNMLTAVGMTAGTAGANGKPFSNAAHSLITGAALVAAPDPGMPASDIVCFRGYFSTGAQVSLPPSGSLYCPYSVTFT